MDAGKENIFGERLALLRRRAGLKQAEVGDLVGIPGSTWSNYEVGKTEPNLSALVRIADFFNVTVDFLLGRQMQGEAHALAGNKGSTNTGVKEEVQWVEAHLDTLKAGWKKFAEETGSNLTFDEYSRAMWRDSVYKQKLDDLKGRMHMHEMGLKLISNHLSVLEENRSLKDKVPFFVSLAETITDDSGKLTSEEKWVELNMTLLTLNWSLFERQTGIQISLNDYCHSLWVAYATVRV